MTSTESEYPAEKHRVQRASKGVRRMVTVLLALHALLLAFSIPKNAVTVDEVMHLPVGMSYWHQGAFWAYHHNPPLMRLLFALPAVLLDVQIDYTNFHYIPGARISECLLGRDFMLLNQDHYMMIYIVCRCTVAAMSVLGAYLIFMWSRELFGNAGAVLSLALWVLSPNVLAHAGLVTPDVGATVVGLAASYAFWRYLQRPSRIGAFHCGILLGLALGAKFSLLLLPFVWATLAGLKLAGARRERSDYALGCCRCLADTILVVTVSLLVLNGLYLYEGVGRPLGAFDFRSRMLTQERLREAQCPTRENRFRGTILENLPVPLPEHFVLGFDDQMYDSDSYAFHKYLRGELRERHGWWYYYLYCVVVKCPLGTLLLIAGATVAAMLTRSCRSDVINEATIVLPILVFFAAISSQIGLNSHFRYVMPAFPFAFVFVGRLGRLSGPRRGLWIWLLSALIGANALSVLRVHPHYLTYFNELAGGPLNGKSHLAESNLDWGQGLLALRDWLGTHAPGHKVFLAYYGNMYPEIVGINYQLPPPEGPVPGLHAVSAHYLVGLPFAAPNGHASQSSIPRRSLVYYNRFEPIAVPGNSIYVYNLTLAEVKRVRADLAESPLAEDSMP